MIPTRWAIAASAIVAAAPALAGDAVLFGPVPEWVSPVAAGAAEEDSTLPVRVLLVDNQLRLEPGRRHIYSSVVLKFQASQGLSAGNLSFPWRQDSDDLTVHKVLIRRGDETIDVLASGQTFSVLRREQNLESAMLDGVLTANMFPEGLQVGDILEVATTLVTNDPVLAGHSQAAIGPLNAALARAHLRLTWPASARVRLDKTDDLPAWQRRRENGFETAELTLDNVTPIAVPDGAPVRYHLVRMVEASDFASWGELAEIFVPLYRAAAVVPAEGPLRAELERIRAASSDPVERTEAALELVQSRIRYVALTMGDGGLVPASAAETWARRYGDCKAKTALMLALLGELGIDAEAVVVNTVLGDSVADRLPATSAFNHVIVRAHIGGRDYWLDGTRTGDTSLARLQVPHYGWGLPIRPRAELVRMVPPPLTEPDEDLAIHMDASEGIRGPVPTRIELTLRGDSALGTNQVMTSLLGEDRDRALREYWRRRFSFIEPAQVAFDFDPALGELRMTMQGAATLEWDGVWYETDETRVGYRADFSREPGYASDAPFTVTYPTFERTRQTIVLPFSGEARPEWNVDETVAGVEYKRRAGYEGSTFTVERTARTVAPEFPARDASAFQKRLRELRDTGVHVRIPNGYRPSEADLAVSRDDMSGSAADLVARGHMLMTAGRNDEALPMFDRAAELDPQNAFAVGNRGIALLNLNRPEEAAAAFDRAEAIDPRNFVIFNGRGRLAERQRDWQAAADAYSKVLELDPGNQYALARRANMQLGLQKPDAALADAAAALRLNPQLFEMYGLRTFILTRSGRREEAAAEVGTMLAALPGDARALGVATQTYNDLGMRDEARALAERALEGEPTALVHYNLSRGRDPYDTATRLADLDNALSLDPAFAPALTDRANLHLYENRLEEALADTATLVELPTVPPEINVLRANIFTRMGRRDDALAEAVAVVAANPEMPWAHTAAGKIYSRFGLREEALAAIDRAIELAPDGGFYVDRSQVRERTDWAARLADIDEQLRRMPNDMSALFARAELLTDKGDHADAAEVYSRVLETQEESPEVLHSRGLALWRSGRREDGEADFLRARGLAHDASVLNNFCYTKAVAEVALEQALEECEESLRIRPDFPPTLDSRGAVLLRLGRLDEAIRDFDRVLEVTPTMTNSRYLRAVARSRGGDTAGAEADLEIVRRDNPELIESMARRGFVVAGGEAAAAE